MSKYVVYQNKLKPQLEGRDAYYRGRNWKPLISCIYLTDRTLTHTKWFRSEEVLAMTPRLIMEVEWGLEGFTAAEEESLVALADQCMTTGDFTAVGEHLAALQRELEVVE